MDLNGINQNHSFRGKPMSIILCPIHGESGFCLRFSKKVVDAIELDLPLPDNDLFLFNIRLVDNEDDEELYTETYLLLKVEFEALDAPSLVSVDTEEEYDRYKAMLPPLGGLCAECFREYKQRHNINLLGFN